MKAEVLKIDSIKIDAETTAERAIFSYITGDRAGRKVGLRAFTHSCDFSAATSMIVGLVDAPKKVEGEAPVEVNINDNVWVKLTDHGAEVLRKFISDLDLKSYEEPITGQFMRFQLWDLMRIFGLYIGMALPQVFMNNQILFEEPK